MLNGFYFILGRDVAACFEINCTNVLGLASKGSAILEKNKLMLKTENIRKSVQTNLCNKDVYKNRDCREVSRGFFFFSFFFFCCVQKKLESAEF